MREKARFVMTTMQERLRTLGGTWDRVTAIDIYTAHPIHELVQHEILPWPAPPPSAACTGIPAARPSRGSSTRWI